MTQPATLPASGRRLQPKPCRSAPLRARPSSLSRRDQRAAAETEAEPSFCRRRQRPLMERRASEDLAAVAAVFQLSAGDSSLGSEEPRQMVRGTALRLWAMQSKESLVSLYNRMGFRKSGRPRKDATVAPILQCCIMNARCYSAFLRPRPTVLGLRTFL